MREHRIAAWTAHAKSRLLGAPYIYLPSCFLVEPCPPTSASDDSVFVRDFATGRMIGSFLHKHDAKKAIAKAADVVDDEPDPVVPKWNE